MSVGEPVHQAENQFLSATEGDGLPTTSKPKVLVLIDTLDSGGTERSTLEISSRYRDWEPIVCAIYEGDELEPSYHAAGIQVVKLDVQKRYAFGRAMWRLVRLLRRIRPQLIHTSLFRADVIGRIAGWLMGMPVISSFVNTPYDGLRVGRFGRLTRVKVRSAQLLDAITARCVDHVVAVSEAAKSSNCDALRLSQDRVTVIYRGRDPSVFWSVTPLQQKLLRLEENLVGPVLLSVARLVPTKGHEILLRAHAHLCKNVESTLLLVGEGPERASLEQLAVELGTQHLVRFMGSRQDVNRLLALADVFVLQSRIEGHSGAVIEAMMAAKPIVATAIPQNAESLEHGVTGLLVPTDEPTATAEALRTLLEDPDLAQRIGEAARTVATQRFDVHRVAEAQEAVYNQLLGRAARDEPSGRRYRSPRPTVC